MNVSVLIPVFNAEKYLQQSVESALQQPETGEVIIWDDCSTDSSLSIARDLEHQHDKVKVFNHSENLGNYAVRNRLIQASTCEYIAFLDADDYFLPGRFTEAKRIFESDPTVDGVYEAFENFYDELGKQEQWIAETTLGERLVALPYADNGNNLFKHVMLYDSRARGLPHLTVKRDVFTQIISPFDEQLRHGGDMVALFQMLVLCRLVPGRLDQPVMMRRLHALNLTRTIHKTKDPVKVYFRWALHTLDTCQMRYLVYYVMRHVNRRSEFHKARLYSVLPFRLSKLLQHLWLLADFPQLSCKLLYWIGAFYLLRSGRIPVSSVTSHCTRIDASTSSQSVAQK